jgi:hypothetical protein
MSFVIRRLYRPIVIQGLTYLSSVTSIWRMLTLGGILEIEGCRDGAGGHLPPGWCALCVNNTVINRVWETYRLHGKPARRHAGRRKRVTTPVKDLCMIVQARRARFSTATSLRNDLANAAGVRVFTQTVRGRLSKGNLRSRRPCIRILFPCRHR